MQDGDTLASIAATVYGDPTEPTTLYAANQALIDEHGRPGALVVPAPQVHTLQPRRTLRLMRALWTR